ncbi:DNA replication protein DnaD [Streptomyces sp. SID4928]|nr:DNA replication protein DnaD [Streptomyces sp. SID4928]
MRRLREDGVEYWSARELMPLLGYKKWERFADAVEQARSVIEAENGSLAAEQEASLQREAFGRTRQIGDNYWLSRRASYLTAMRGDSRKPEIRAALIYFANRTREAELGHASQFSIPTTFAGALALAAQQAAELEETRTEVAELVATNAKLSPRARVADKYEANPGVNPTVFHKTHFTAVPERDFFEHLYRKDYLIDQRNSRWDERNGEWKDGPEHRHPTAKGKRYFYLAPKIDRRGVRRQQTLVVPGDAEHDLVAALERDGLPSRNRPALPGSQVTQLPRRPLGGAA